MKMTVKHLNNRELKAFNRFYETLKEFPDFKFQNIFNSQTREYYSIKSLCSNLLHKELGRSKLIRLNVSIHEAGHAVAMAATHWKVGEAVLSDDGKSLAGHVAPPGYTGEQSYEPIETSLLPTKYEIHSKILIDAAGFVAEETFANFKSRAYHEKFLTFVQSRYLDELNGNDPLHHWNFFMNWCRSILINNEQLLHAISDELLEFNQLTKDSIDLLHRRVKREQPHLFF